MNYMLLSLTILQILLLLDIIILATFITGETIHQVGILVHELLVDLCTLALFYAWEARLRNLLRCEGLGFCSSSFVFSLNTISSIKILWYNKLGHLLIIFGFAETAKSFRDIPTTIGSHFCDRIGSVIEV